MQIKLTIQERLKDLRVERGLTLEQLAEQTGLSKSALGKYEADDFNRSCMVSFICMAHPSFFLSLSVEIQPVLHSFPTSWIYGKERIFSLNCTCNNT